LETSEPREPSYYEVALTNRQVLVAFVVLLTCLLAAFLSGVWIGRGAGTGDAVAVQAAAPPPGEPPLEQLTFFSGKEPGARTAAAKATPAPTPVPTPSPTSAPAAPEVVAAPREDATAGESLRRTLEAEVAAARAPLASATPAPTPTPISTPKPTAKAAAPPAPAVATGKIYVQVYSSGNAARAQEILAQLRQGGFPVQLSEVPRDGQTNYRVRVGPFDSRARAQSAADRLRRDYRLDTWVTDTP
jgi:cell division septation protein DedD